MATQESRWLCYLLAELCAPQRCPTLWCDNASTIHLTQDPVYHARSKHIELRYFFIRELVQQRLLAVWKITATPREWHDTFRMTLATLDFLSSSVNPSISSRKFCLPFSKLHLAPLAVDHGLTAPFSNEPFESSGPYPELVGCLICEAEVYDAATAAQELRWLYFLLTGLGERPLSSPVLFADNRSAVLLCEEPRLVGKAMHIQLRYFLLRELQQCGQSLVRPVVSEANTAHIFTKALPPCDHQRFCTQLGLMSIGPHLLA
ncbi:unnamed protein product [Closterium sp. NIES-53]